MFLLVLNQKLIQILFRVDGSRNIGIGHMMRSYALISKLCNVCDITVITKEKYTYDFFIGKDIKTELLCIKKTSGVKLGYDYGNESSLAKEIEIIGEVLKGRSYDFIFVDMYNINDLYCAILRKHGVLVIVEDYLLGVKNYDFVLNYNIYAYELYRNDGRAMLGPKFYCARSEFLSAEKYNVRKDIRKILVTTGGSDPYSVSDNVINAIGVRLEYEFDIIVGAGYDGVEKIVSNIPRGLTVNFHQNVKNMAALFVSNDLVVSTAGSTLYELSLLGVPTISVIAADNQILSARKFSENQMIASIGDVRKMTNEKFTNSINKIISEYSYQERIERSKRMRCLLDGLGAERILDRLSLFQK